MEQTDLFYVYVIESREGLRYTGQTPDIDRRLTEHNAGRSHSTKHGTEWKVVYLERQPNRSAAMKREKYLKSGAGRDFLERTIRRVESAAAE